MNSIPSFEWSYSATSITIAVFLVRPVEDSEINIQVTASHLKVVANKEKLFDLDLSFKTDPDSFTWVNKEDQIRVTLVNKNNEEITSPVIAPLRMNHVHLENSTVTTFEEENPPLQLESLSEFFNDVRDDLITYSDKFSVYAKEKENELFESSDLTSIPVEERLRLAEERYQQAVSHPGSDLQGKLKLYKEGAALGHVKCRLNVAKILQSKQSTEPDALKKAFDNYLAAAVDNQSGVALFTLGRAYHHGTLGVTADPNTSKMLYVKGAIVGDANCMYELGEMAREEEDLDKAIAWWHLALNRGDPRAAQAIGALQQNPEIAHTYYAYAHQVSDTYAIPEELILALAGLADNEDDADWEDVGDDADDDSEDAIFKRALRNLSGGATASTADELALESLLNEFMGGGALQKTQNSTVTIEEVQEEPVVVQQPTVVKKQVVKTAPAPAPATTSVARQVVPAPTTVSTTTVANPSTSSRVVEDSVPVTSDPNVPSKLWKVLEWGLTAGIIVGSGVLVHTMINKSFGRR
ncbi:chr4 [Acrasis kona]|uniref:Chr4 n=1 Tax=Acrasis kona TaxID=1008807 RepID=A0AAW2YKB8_9EUKA